MLPFLQFLVLFVELCQKLGALIGDLIGLFDGLFGGEGLLDDNLWLHVDLRVLILHNCVLPLLNGQRVDN
jgi:hypothetical protein